MAFRLPEYKWRIFAVTGFASITSGIAISSITLALPVMADEFGVSMATISWLSLVYSLIPSCLLLIFGRLADLYGYKRQFIGGFIVFGLSSLLLPALSRGMAGLIFFRSLQSIGYSMMISITQAMCNRVFPPNERGKALGVNSIFVSIGLSAGPSISGLLLSRFTWRSVFYFNAPSCFLGLIMTIMVLKKDEPAQGRKPRMDWLGSMLFAAAVGSLAVAINFSAEWGLVSAWFISCLVISAISLAVFIYRENHTDEPLMKLGFYKNPVFSLANCASVCSYALQQMTNFLVPFYLLNILLVSKSDAGFITLATPLAMMLFSPYGGRMADRGGSRKPSVIGLIIIAAGCLGMCFLTDTAPIVYVIAALFLYGVGNGLSVSAINSAIFSAAPREDSGMASGMVATLRNLGQGLGVAFGGAIIAVRQNHYLSQRVAARSGGSAGDQIYLMAQRDAFLFGLGIVILAIICMSKVPDIVRE